MRNFQLTKKNLTKKKTPQLLQFPLIHHKKSTLKIIYSKQIISQNGTRLFNFFKAQKMCFKSHIWVRKKFLSLLNPPQIVKYLQLLVILFRRLNFFLQPIETTRLFLRQFYQRLNSTAKKFRTRFIYFPILD